MRRFIVQSPVRSKNRLWQKNVRTPPSINSLSVFIPYRRNMKPGRRGRLRSQKRRPSAANGSLKTRSPLDLLDCGRAEIDAVVSFQAALHANEVGSIQTEELAKREN